MKKQQVIDIAEQELCDKIRSRQLVPMIDFIGELTGSPQYKVKRLVDIRQLYSLKPNKQLVGLLMERDELSNMLDYTDISSIDELAYRAKEYKYTLKWRKNIFDEMLWCFPEKDKRM